MYVSLFSQYFDIFRSNFLVCQSYNAGVWGPPQRACRRSPN